MFWEVASHFLCIHIKEYIKDKNIIYTKYMFWQAASHLLRHPFGRASYTEGTYTGGEICSMLNIFLHPCFDIEFNHVFITRHGWNICAVTFCTYCPPPENDRRNR